MTAKCSQSLSFEHIISHLKLIGTYPLSYRYHGSVAHDQIQTSTLLPGPWLLDTGSTYSLPVSELATK